MNPEKLEVEPKPVEVTIDISDGWDTESQIEILLKELRKQKFYKEGLLYGGFDATNEPKNSGIIFCSRESEITSNNENVHNPFIYATNNTEKPAMAVYDPDKLSYNDEEQGEYAGYKLKQPDALIAVIYLEGI